MGGVPVWLSRENFLADPWWAGSMSETKPLYCFSCILPDNKKQEQILWLIISPNSVSSLGYSSDALLWAPSGWAGCSVSLPRGLSPCGSPATWSHPPGTLSNKRMWASLQHVTVVSGEQKQRLPSLLRTGSESYHLLLVKASHKTHPDSRGGRSFHTSMGSSSWKDRERRNSYWSSLENN